MQPEYIDLVVQAYLKKKSDKFVIDVNDFVKATGVRMQDIVAYLNENDWQERTIGLYQKK